MRKALVVLLLCVVLWGVVEGVDISSTTINAQSWQYYTLDLSTMPEGTVRAVLYFTVSGGSSNVQVFAQYDSQPSTTSNTALNQTETVSGKYFVSVVISQTTGSLIFGIFNPTTSSVTVSSGRYYFGVEQKWPDLFKLQSLDYSIKAGTATFFELSVLEATSQALSVSLKYTNTDAFKSEANNLLLRRDLLPNIVASDPWGVLDYQSNWGENAKGQQLAGWEAWFRKGIVSGTYYITLYNSDKVDHVVTLRVYLTQIFELKAGDAATKVTAESQKKIVLTYETDTSSNHFLKVEASAGANRPSVLIQKSVCPTGKTFQSWASTQLASGRTTYTTSVSPSTSYCIVVYNPSPGSYDVSVSASQTSSSGGGSSTGSIVTTDEYGDGVEPIEIAGIVMGTFIGIFALIFCGWFLLILLQMDRDAWFDADPLTSDPTALELR